MALPTPNLSLARPDHGDFPDTWEIPVNLNMDSIDAVFDAVRSDGGGTGHIHDGTAGQGPPLDHTDLLTIGTKTHAQLELDEGKSLVTGADTTLGLLGTKVVAGANVTLTVLNPGANEQIEVSASSSEATIGGGADPTGSYGWHSFIPTSAGVSYTDNFSYPPSFKLSNAGYASSFTSPSAYEPDYITTGYSGYLLVDPSRGDETSARACYTALCHIPHGPQQRATISITDIDYANMHAGDDVEFTLHLYATDTLGPSLPPKYGVVLEVHLVKLTDGPDTWQMSHRVFIIPDDSTMIQLFEHHHSDPDTFRGCWEISLDANGHIYHYWRRHLVYTSQTIPPSSPGPVQPYFAALTASLTTIGDPPYGAIGFGTQYNIRPDSKFDMEIRWFSLNGENDLYYEPGLPGTYAYGGPTVIDVPSGYWVVPPGGPGPGIPGEVCCESPPYPVMVSIGDVVSDRAVVGCNTIHINNGTLVDHTIVDGYTLQGDAFCTPCAVPYIPNGSLVIPEDGLIPVDTGTDINGDWVGMSPHAMPRDGRDVKFFIERYVTAIPPNVGVTSSDAAFQITNVEWIDYDAIQVWATIDPDSAGILVSLDIFDQDIPAKTITLTDYFEIQGSSPVPTVIVFEDPELHETPPNPFTEVPNYNFTITGSRFGGGSTVTSSLGTVTGFTVDDPQTISGTIDYSSSSAGTDTITVSDPGFPDGTLPVTVQDMPPMAVSGQVDQIGFGLPGTATFGVPFLTGIPTLSALPDPLFVTFSNVNYVSPTLSFDYTINGPPCPPNTPLYVEILDPSTGLTAMAPLCTAANPGNFHTIAGVTTDVTPYAGRTIEVTVNGALFDHDVFMTVGGIAWVGRNTTNGYVRQITRTAAQLKFLMSLDPVDIAAVASITVYGTDNPAVVARTDTFPAAFTVQTVPAIGYTTHSFGGPVDAGGFPIPGTGGTMTVDGTGFTDVTGEIDLTVDGSDDFLTLTPGTLTIIGPLQLTMDYTVSALANGSTENLTITQNLDGATAGFPAQLAVQTPVIETVTFGGPVEVGRTMSAFIHGTGFDPAATVFGAGVVVNFIVSQTATDIEVDITFPGGAGPFSLTVQNPDLQQDVYNGTLNAQSPVEIFHGITEFDDGKMYSGTATTLSLYGENLDVPGILLSMLPEVTLAGPVTSNRTYASVPVNIVGPVGSTVSCDVTTTFGGPYGPFVIGSIDELPATVEISGVSTTQLKENTNYPDWTVYGTNMLLIDPANTVISFKAGVDTEKGPTTYVPKGGVPPVAINSWVQTATSIEFDITLEPGLQPRWFSVSLRDGGAVELHLIESAFEATPLNSNVLSIQETLADDTASVTGGATYDMELPIMTAVPYFPADNVVAVGAVINTQVFDSLATPYPVWRLNVTNNAAPGDIEFRIERPGLGGWPPIGTHFIPLDGALV